MIGKIKPTECAHFGLRCTPDSPLGALFIWAGLVGLAIAGLRALKVLFADQAAPASPEKGEPDPEPNSTDAWIRRGILAGGTALLLAAGIAPGWIAWLAERLPPAFEQLNR